MVEKIFKGKISRTYELEININASQKYAWGNYIFYINGLAYFNFYERYFLVNELNCERLQKLYEKYGLYFYEYLVGDYSIGVLDVEKKKWIIVQGEVASTNTLYFWKEGHVLMFDVMLRRLLLKTNMERKLNEDVLDEFVLNGYIVGKKTLIQGISKLPPSHILIYDIEEGKLNLICKRNAFNKCFDDVANDELCIEQYEYYMKDLKSNIMSNPWALCLSSGFDSNFLLYYLRKNMEGKIVTLTAGGKVGKNEIDSVRKILNSYEKVDNYECVIDKTIVEQLPDIIWQLEASVYDKGIFLDYVLANKAKEIGINTIIMGEGHDEIYNIEQEKNFLIYNILKKSGSFFDNNGIRVIRPYLCRRIIKMICEENKEARKDKVIFIEHIKKTLPDDIVMLLSKRGGSIDLETIFEDNSELERCSKLVLDSKIFSQRKMESLIRLTNSRKQVVLGCLYIVVFTKLYLSGTFDSSFLQRNINLRLNELFQ